MSEIYEIIKKYEGISENKELCTKCKGACCKTVPCSFLPGDLELTKDNLVKLLNEGQTSIKVKVVNFLEKDKIYSVPVPTVSMRGKRRDAIDLLSPSTMCVAHSKEGCKLENKPSCAKLLIPGEDGFLKGGQNPCYNILGQKNYLILLEWMQHHKILIDVIEDYTQKSFEDVYYRDILELSRLFISRNINEYNFETMSPIIRSMEILPYIINYKQCSRDNIKNPNKDVENYLNPNEKTYQRVRTFFENHVK